MSLLQNYRKIIKKERPFVFKEPDVLVATRTTTTHISVGRDIELIED